MSNPRTATVELPAAGGTYDDKFPGGVSIGASGSSRSDDVVVWVSREGGGELTAANARVQAASLLAAADACDAENQASR